MPGGGLIEKLRGRLRATGRHLDGYRDSDE
jgi:hypothetical protein